MAKKKKSKSEQHRLERVIGSSDTIDIDDLAEALGVDPEDLAEELGIDIDEDFWESFDPDEDPEVFDELAELLDLDVSDIYDMYYGYAPGGGSK